MTAGLQLWDASGNLTFDSTVATGGVCLGFFTVAAGGSTFAFTDFSTETGIALNASTGTGAFLFTTDNSLGYLRFVFDPLCAGIVVVLFAK